MYLAFMSTTNERKLIAADMFRHFKLLSCESVFQCTLFFFSQPRPHGDSINNTDAYMTEIFVVGVCIDCYRQLPFAFVEIKKS